MDSEKFDELLSDIRDQLEAENLDYVLCVANHVEGKPVEGIVGVKTDHGLDSIADMIFCAAVNGETGPQHFIERIIENVIHATSHHLKHPDKKDNDVNYN